MGHSTDAESDEEQEMVTPDLTVSSVPGPDVYTEASEGDTQASGDESGGEEYGEEFDDAHSTLSVLHLQGRELSPVAEVSPEAISRGSTESLNRNCVDLESELNTALSQLNTLTNELNEVEVEESILESRQTKMTETVTFESVPEAMEEDQRNKNSSGSSYEGIISSYHYLLLMAMKLHSTLSNHSKSTPYPSN